MATLTNPISTGTTGAVCDISLVNQYDTFGVLNRANIKALSPTGAKALYTPDSVVWYELGALLNTQFEMQLCGIERKGIYDWVMASNRVGMSKLWQTQRRDRGPSIINPYIMGRTVSPYNDQYWILSTGFATGSYTPASTGPLAAVTGTINGLPVMTGSRVFRLTAAYGVPLSAQYFLPRHFLFVLNTSSGGTALHGQWQILDAALAADATYVDVLVNQRNPDTTTVDTTPTTGIVMIGVNSVHDPEEYCKNAINVNPNHWVPFWIGVRRWGRRINSAYRELLSHLTANNEWFRRFQDLPINERNRQDQVRDEKEFVRQFFWGRALTPKQNLNQWFDAETTDPVTTGLRRVKSLTGATIDPGTGDELREYEAMPVGAYDQLKGCGQVYDLQGQALDIVSLISDKVYNVVRMRSQQGREVGVVRIIADSISAVQFQSAMVAYHRSVFGQDFTLNIGQDSDSYGFNFKKFILPGRPFGVVVELATHLYFDDQVSVFSGLAAGQQSRGRFLMILDMGPGGTIYPAILKTNRVVHITGELEKLAAIEKSFACVMENPTYETVMTSIAWTAVVECPLNSLWVENFSSITGPA